MTLAFVPYQQFTMRLPLSVISGFLLIDLSVTAENTTPVKRPRGSWFYCEFHDITIPLEILIHF